ncbi:MAG: hypothetical protein IJU95_02020 [Treponema sp.]|nr:hypothetical protein [Treponema sp.]
MKKILFALVLAAGMVMAVAAQDTTAKKVWDHGDNVSDISYQTFVVSRIYDSLDAYTILYEKAGYKIGKVSIPKSWAYQGVTPEAHKTHKLFFRNKIKTIDNLMTVFYKGGEFYKVVLTVPVSKADDVWAVAPNGYDAGVSADATTLDVKF